MVLVEMATKPDPLSPKYEKWIGQNDFLYFLCKARQRDEVITPKTPVSAVVPLSALSVLCFCERRLSHDPRIYAGFRPRV